MALNKSYIKSKSAFKVKFSVASAHNPKSKEIRVLGDFNQWNFDQAPVLSKTKGIYQTSIEIPAGQKYEFRYVLNGTDWINDDQPDAYTPSPFAHSDNSVLDLTQIPTEKNKTKSVIAKKKPAKAKAAKATKATKVDFKKIEGVGPKIAELILAAGYNSYELLSKAKKKDLLSLLADAGNRYKMHDPSSWAKQAKLLASNNLEKLKELQAQLKGGK